MGTVVVVVTVVMETVFCFESVVACSGYLTRFVRAWVVVVVVDAGP